MARNRSDRIDSVKLELLRKIGDGHYRPGDRFLSNRAIAAKYRVCYQTADRLVRELCQDGHLERRAASGTYLPGKKLVRRGACLCFHARARRPASFGARLLQELIDRLDQVGIEYRVVFDDEPMSSHSEGWYPVHWEWSRAPLPRTGLMLHRRPASGMDSTLWDSVTADDFSGGVCAAQVLRGHVERGSKWVVISGPSDDYRSSARVAGFCSQLPATIIEAGWFVEDGIRVARQVLDLTPSGIFCANDRLAEGLHRVASTNGTKLPAIVGFDNAPIAERLGLTTIAIPWAELTMAATNTIRHRLSDPWSTGTHQVVAPRPIIRW